MTNQESRSPEDFEIKAYLASKASLVLRKTISEATGLEGEELEIALDKVSNESLGQLEDIITGENHHGNLIGRFLRKDKD